MSKKKEIIRITESELKQIIDESVKTILEGQGWNYFKSQAEKILDTDYEDRKDMVAKMRDPKYRYGERAQFVGNGDFNARKNFYAKNKHDYYDKDGMPTKDPNGKPINKNLMGRLGRLAGAKGAEYLARTMNGIHKMSDKLADPDFNPLSPFSKNGPQAPFDDED